jgi:nucleoside-diphosphate kinase
MELTCILLKPDCIEKNLSGEVVRRFEEGGLRIRGCKMMRLSEDLLREHYAHLAHLPFFPEIVQFMQSTPVLALALEGEQAVARVREMLGPTDSTKAAKGTIRGDLGTDKMRNIAHASDSAEAAAAELRRFFGKGEVFPG